MPTEHSTLRKPRSAAKIISKAYPRAQKSQAYYGGPDDRIFHNTRQRSYMERLVSSSIMSAYSSVVRMFLQD
ncbi:Uncharacterised protein [uncultured archaeon]|nr:Uncharacterised protein [uncultured archaeon]